MLPRFWVYNALPALAEHVFDLERYPDTGKLYDKDVVRSLDDVCSWHGRRRVFVKNDFVQAFVERVLPAIRCDLVLLLGVGDLEPPPAALRVLLEHPRIRAVFATNVSLGFVSHPRLFHVPIGLPEVDRPTGAQPLFAAHYDRAYASRAALSEAVRGKRVRMYLPPMPKGTALREEVRRACVESGVVAVDHDELGPSEYLSRVSDALVCVVPRGNGRDVHRVYECVLAGTLPLWIGPDPPGILGALRLPWLPSARLLPRWSVPSPAEVEETLWQARESVLSSRWSRQILGADSK